MAQVEYRLSDQCGCDLEHQEQRQEAAEEADAQVAYRLGDARDLEWIGGGLQEVGLVAGESVDKDQARLLMDGRHPLTSERLVTPKVAVDPRAKLSARPLAEAIEAAAAERGVSVDALLNDEKLSGRFARMERGVHREGDRHRVPVRAAEDLADAAGVDPVELYGHGQMEEAREYADARIRVGNRGYDMTLDLSKTYSTAVALAGDQLSDELRETFLDAARETFGAMEGWAAYAMAGEHGNGKSADRVDTSGFLGWMTVHYSARPVGGVPGDPHLHVHANIANMALAQDGKWRTVGAGGRDILRHAHAADSLVKARLRQLTGERFGMRWERHAETGAWEVVGIDEVLRREFSRRANQITAVAADGATTLEQKLIARQLAEGKDVTITTGDVRASWRSRAEAVVGDVDAMMRRAVPGPEGPDGPSVAGPGGGPIMPSPGEIAGHIWRREGGLTESRKAVTRADVLAYVIDACPFGVPNLAAAEALTDAVLAVDGEAVALPESGMAHLTNPQRYTHASFLAAEETITETVTDRLAEGAAKITREAAELAIAAFETSRTTDLLRPFRMSYEQRAATMRFLTGGQGVDVLRGKAGTGKTTIMSAARTGWEAAGLRISGAATAAVAASKLQAESGIASATVATWLMNIRDGGRRMATTDVLVLEEAAMIDDRDVAELLTAAAEHGVKVVQIGDWAQLKAIGVGGGFKRAHEITGGLELSENRRQKDAVERAALEAWLDGGRRTALAMLAEHGHVHAVRTPDDAYAAMLGAWRDAVARLEGDVHEQIEDLVVLAARNADVEVLNLGARELRKKAGELTGGHTYALAGGERIELAAGDIIRIKRNGYRTRRGGDVDVLNGYRGQVTHTSTGGVAVEWRRPADDGGYVVERAWITADQIADGALQHGYAMTIAAAQGLTADHALVYGVGAEANTLYPALSRAREATHLWLPADVVESEDMRLRLGEACSEQELLDRAVAAYADSLEHDSDDRMVSDELATALGRQPVGPIPQQAQPEPEFLAWNHREYGNIATQRLFAVMAERTEQALRSERLADDLTRQAEAKLAQLAAPVTPGQERPRAVAAVLNRADRFATTAAAERENERRAYAAMSSSQDIRDKLEESMSRSRMALRLAGTSRKETADLSAEHAQRANAAYQEARRAGQAAEDAQRESWTAICSPETVDWFENQGSRAGAPHTVDELTDKLAAMRERLPEIERITDWAITEDAQRTERQAAEYRGHARIHRIAVTGLQNEKALRLRMATEAPGQHSREAQQRAAHIQTAQRQQREQQVARQAAARTQSEHGHQLPTRSDPSLRR
ncbi:relaxase domain-containing protein (plasmid) [Streptomyces sp. NBC_00873]|uniref:MobF family relaxase n=1 Tax=Streptomyces sp. NBC_00873 TaxID=2975852 RepID=UPI002F912E4E|nr:relaxase domain-containing protein [Streptomyces sp. NBC_00873]